ncbi:MAG: hypothetical protein ACJ8DZ_00785 [Allosphingosinicella sp.]
MMLGSARAVAGKTLPPGKMQGFILRGYSFPFVRHFALTVRDAAAARAFVAGLVDGGAGPQITSAEEWAPTKPHFCLNIGFTYPGLQALGVPQAVLDASFANPDHQPFVDGSAARAPFVGDVGQSDPAGWTLSDRGFHVMLSLWAQSVEVREAVTATLAGLFAAGFGPADPAIMFDSQDLPDDQIYFGYRDSIAQPIVCGAQFPRSPDGGQDIVDPGLFVLGEATGAFAQSFPVPTPDAFGHYGCFGAFRILHQDVEGFDAHIESIKAEFGKTFAVTDPEVQRLAVKAKMCGRWPNGTPLSLYPVNGNQPAPALHQEQLNDFQYTLPNGDPSNPAKNPDIGTNCPVSSHIRRANMRDFPLAASSAAKRRIMRRAMPYQSPYDPLDRNTGERGLMGFFLCACLREQFEFVQHNWINNGAQRFSIGNDDHADPLMGTNPDPAGGAYTETLRKPGGKISDVEILPMNSFVTTKGSAYLYFPGMDGISYVASAAG